MMIAALPAIKHPILRFSYLVLLVLKLSSLTSRHGYHNLGLPRLQREREREREREQYVGYVRYVGIMDDKGVLGSWSET